MIKKSGQQSLGNIHDSYLKDMKAGKKKFSAKLSSLISSLSTE